MLGCVHLSSKRSTVKQRRGNWYQRVLTAVLIEWNEFPWSDNDKGKREESFSSREVRVPFSSKRIERREEMRERTMEAKNNRFRFLNGSRESANYRTVNWSFHVKVSGIRNDATPAEVQRG